MKFDTLQKDMIAAMKAHDKARKDSISVLVSAAKKLAIDGGCREDIPEDMVDQAVIGEVLIQHEYPEECAEKLKQLALENGGRDNITVIVIDVY